MLPSHQRWLEELLELRNGIPHADTYRRVFALISPESLQNCFLRWIGQIATKTKGEVIAIDGKQCFERIQSSQQNEIEFEFSHQSQIEASHHRLEKRTCWVLPVAKIQGLYKQEQWSGLRTIVMVKRKRHLWNKIQTETQFYLSSLPCDAKVISRAIRQHWGIENQLHWVLDVTFNEDSSRIRQGHSPENFTLLRRMAISLLNQETNSKRSLRQKTKLAAMNCNYMFDVLRTALK